MPKVNHITRSLNAGELSPLMQSRTDQQKYVAGCRTLENFFPLVHGGAQRRPGLEYIATQSATQQNDPGDNTAAGRMVSFERSVSNVYTVCFENLKIRVFKSGDRVMNTSINVSGFTNPSGAVCVVTTAASHQYSDGDVVRFDGLVGTTEANYNGNHATEYTITVTAPTTFSLDGTDGDNFTTYVGDAGDTVASVYEIITPYLTADIPDLKVEHSADVMYITHGSYEPRKLSRTGDTSWTLDVTDYRTGPFRPQNIDITFTITPNTAAAVGGAVTLTASKALFVDGVTAGHKPTSITSVISTYADYTGTIADTTLITTAAVHGLSTADIIQITGSVSYDGQWNITVIDTSNFYIKKIFVADTTTTAEVTEVIDKAHTGALFDVIQNIAGGSLEELLTDDYVADQTENVSWVGPLTMELGQKWDYTTTGIWTGTLQLQRNETIGAGDGAVGWEVIHTVTSADNRNVTVPGTEETARADYRVIMISGSTSPEACTVHLNSRAVKHHGIAEVVTVTNTKVAVCVARNSIAATTATSKWAEGSWSNYRGWPRSVSMSPEDRLVYAGNSAQPLDVWGSEIGNWINYLSSSEFVDDSDPIAFALIGSGQQNEIQWSVPKASVVLGTVGGEHLLGASKDDEALTPTNVQAKLQTTYGSENIRAIIVNQAIIFLQRGGKKLREFLYNFEADSHKADDLTVFSEHITGSGGIVAMAFQRTPDPMLWCVRSDGEMAVMNYERDQNVFSWSRVVTDGSFESVAVVYGGTNSEDEVWVTVKRVISGKEVRYVERFKEQKFTSMADFMFLDGAKLSDRDFSQRDLNNASDTVRCGDGLCNNGLCGGVSA